jgi:DHA1 family multidrug resistance protein-like MFS transporter
MTRVGGEAPAPTSLDSAMQIRPDPPAESVPTPRAIVQALLGVAVVVGIAELGFGTVIPLLPLYLKERLGASVTLVGAVVATFAAIETVFKTTWGSLADRIGRRPVIVGGLVLASAAPILMTLLKVPVLFIPLRVVDGTGSAAVWPCASAAIADRTGTSRRATAMGTLNMFFLAGLAIGPTIGLVVSGAAHRYQVGFYLASALLLTAAGVAAVAFRDGHPRHEPADPPQVHALLGQSMRDAAAAILGAVRRSPTLGAMLLIGFVQMFGVGLLAPIIVIYAHEVVHLSDQLIGVFFLVMVLAVAAASVPGGHLADHIGRPRTVTWGMVLASVGMWLLPVADHGNFAVLGVAAVLLGGSYAISSPAWLALMSESAPRGSTGVVMGASETAQGAGFVVGPVLGGLLYDHLGPQAPFVASALLLSAATALAVTALGHWRAPST